MTNTGEDIRIYAVVGVLADGAVVEVGVFGGGSSQRLGG
jgi:hypothetical protein